MTAPHPLLVRSAHRLALALAALVLLGPLATAAPAAAQLAPDRTIVVLSKDPYTDTDEEDTEITAALEAEFGADNVSVTDGGDASAATWTGLLASVDTLVIPERNSGTIWETGRTEALRASGSQTWPITDEAMAVIEAWAEAGGVVMGTGSYSHQSIIQELTDRTYSIWWDDYPGNYGDDPGSAGWLQWDSGWFGRLVDDESLPERLPGANYTGGLTVAYADTADPSSDEAWTAEERAALTIVYGYDGPYYFGSGTRTIEQIGVGVFTVGSGAYIYYAYDWYPDENDRDTTYADPTHTAQWNRALVLGAGGQITEAAGIESGGGSTPVASGGSAPVPTPGGGVPALEPAVGVLQEPGGATTALEISSPSPTSVRYSADGLIVTLTGAGGTGTSRGLVATPEGNVECEVCAFLAAGGVIEAWMFSEPRLVAAWRVEELETFLAGLPCQRFTIPVGAPLDGGTAVPVGVHTLQLQLPTSVGLQAVNVGVTVGTPVPTAVRAGEGPGDAPVRAVLLPAILALALGGAVAARRRSTVDRLG